MFFNFDLLNIITKYDLVKRDKKAKTINKTEYYNERILIKQNHLPSKQFALKECKSAFG